MKCLNCKRVLVKRRTKYCDNKCQNDHRYQQYINRWLEGKETGIRGRTQTSKYLYRWVREKQNQTCAICKISKWQGQQVPLVMDHIDGDSSNNDPNNLRMVCGNCDMLLPTYKNKNKGKGRHERRKRYARGQSY